MQLKIATSVFKTTQALHQFCTSFRVFKFLLKILLFLWKFQHQLIPTVEFLASRMHGFGLSSVCGWCGLNRETIDHLLFKCEIS